METNKPDDDYKYNLDQTRTRTSYSVHANTNLQLVLDFTERVCNDAVACAACLDFAELRHCVVLVLRVGIVVARP